MRLRQGCFQDATVTVVDGGTHFVPMERPDLVAGAIIDLGNRVQSPRRR